eukprot:scaffold7055_cov254-Pinguiococcus_pyrenoidosus.AAC.20
MTVPVTLAEHRRSPASLQRFVSRCGSWKCRGAGRWKKQSLGVPITVPDRQARQRRLMRYEFVHCPQPDRVEQKNLARERGRRGQEARVPSRFAAQHHQMRICRTMRSSPSSVCRIARLCQVKPKEEGGKRGTASAQSSFRGSLTSLTTLEMPRTVGVSADRAPAADSAARSSALKHSMDRRSKT